MFNRLAICVVTPEYHCLILLYKNKTASWLTPVPAAMLKLFSAAFNCAFSAVVKEQHGKEVSVINLKLLSRT